MASAQVMAMPVDTATDTRRGAAAAAAEDTAGAQDVYVKLKSLQKHMEFLDIQVRARVVRGKRERGCLACLEGTNFVFRVRQIYRFRCFFSSADTRASRTDAHEEAVCSPRLRVQVTCSGYSMFHGSC